MSCLQCLFFLRAASECVFSATRNSRCHFSSFIQWRYRRYGIRQTWGNRNFAKLCNQSFGALVVSFQMLANSAPRFSYMPRKLYYFSSSSSTVHTRGARGRRMCKQRQVYSRCRRGAHALRSLCSHFFWRRGVAAAAAGCGKKTHTDTRIEFFKVRNCRSWKHILPLIVLSRRFSNKTVKPPTASFVFHYATLASSSPQ